MQTCKTMQSESLNPWKDTCLDVNIYLTCKDARWGLNLIQDVSLDGWVYLTHDMQNSDPNLRENKNLKWWYVYDRQACKMMI